MDNLIREMLEKGLIDFQFRQALAQLPVWLVASKVYKPDPIELADWLRANRN